MSNYKELLEVSRVFEMYGRRGMKLDNPFIEYATRKVYHFLTGKTDLDVDFSDSVGPNRAEAISGSITFYTKVIDSDNNKTLNKSNPNYILNYNLKTLHTVCHEVIHLFQLSDKVSSEMKKLYFDNLMARVVDKNKYALHHDLYPAETHADLFGAFLVSEIVNRTGFSERFKSSVNRNFYRKASNRYLVNGIVVAPTERFYDLISGHAFFKVNRMSFQERLLNGLSISWSEYLMMLHIVIFRVLFLISIVDMFILFSSLMVTKI